MHTAPRHNKQAERDRRQHVSRRTAVVSAGVGALLALALGSAGLTAFASLVRGIAVLLVAYDLVYRTREARYPLVFFRRHLADVVVTVVLVVLSVISLGVDGERPIGLLVAVGVLIRSGYYALRLFAAMRRTLDFLLGITAHPAQSIVSSFAVVIVIGTALLMLPVTGAGDAGLGFLDALFTATSAVCVTGLIVVDTATAFSVWGQLVILLLIQIGGLGIIILSYFVLFVLRRSVGVEDKLLLAYTLSDSDMTRLSTNLRRIVATTFLVEAAGAMLLFVPMLGRSADIGEAALRSVFHAVSAFCNAGFALFSDSLEGFAASAGTNAVFAALIIAGGLSFIVISDIADSSRSPGDKLSLNTRIVLSATGILLVVSLLGFYGLEHGNQLAPMGVGKQYLAAFFQAVTLRTAGFNTVGIGGLTDATLAFMMVFMFIGGASGSTAGGIKVNTVAVHFFAVRARIRNVRQTVAFGQAVSDETVSRAVLILLFGISVCAVFAVVLTVSEHAPFVQVLFETVSAFGTVGLSTGLTPELTRLGRILVIALMFMGRLGPLTILAAASGRRRGLDIGYPDGQVSVG